MLSQSQTTKSDHAPVGTSMRQPRSVESESTSIRHTLSYPAAHAWCPVALNWRARGSTPCTHTCDRSTLCSRNRAGICRARRFDTGFSLGFWSQACKSPQSSSSKVLDGTCTAPQGTCTSLLPPKVARISLCSPVPSGFVAARAPAQCVFQLSDARSGQRCVKLTISRPAHDELKSWQQSRVNMQ